MSASREKRTRQTSLSGLTEQEKREALEAQKTHRKHVAWAVLGGVAAVAVAALLIWDNGVVQKHVTAYTVNDHKYTVADVDYFYYSEYNSYYSTYGTYLFEEGVSLKDQVVSTDEDGNEVSWHDMLLSDAKASLESMTVLYDEAVAQGYTLSEDGQAEVQEALDSLGTYATLYSVSESYYIQNMYGKYMTKSHLEDMLEMYALASEYSEQMGNDFTDAVTTEEIDSYYSENADTLDTYNYHVYYVNGAAETTTDDEGNTVEATEEETAAAMEVAKATAEELQAAVDGGDEAAVATLIEGEESRVSDYGVYENIIGSSVSSIYSEFIYDAARAEGDTTVAEASAGYYVVEFISRGLDEYYPATYRDILIEAEVDEDADVPTEEQLAAALEEAESILASITDEDSFGAEVAEHSSSSTSTTEGLNESATKTATTDANIYAWLFDETRQAGDCEIVENSSGTGYYILYFVSYDEQTYWQQTAATALATDAYNTWYEGISADVTTAEGTGIRFVGE